MGARARPKKIGAQILGTPGFERWTKAELTQLYHSLPESYCKHEYHIEDFMACATLAGCPGILINDVFRRISEPVLRSNLLRAQLIDTEWRNGFRALTTNGDDMKGVTGRFPNKMAIFIGICKRIEG